MAVPSPYTIFKEVKFGPLTPIDVGDIRRKVADQWFNQTLCAVNDSVVRLGIVEGEFHWHKHDAEDEFFFVLEGELFVEVEGRETVALGVHQGYVVPKGTLHRTRAPGRTMMLMMALKGVEPTGD